MPAVKAIRVHRPQQRHGDLHESEGGVSVAHLSPRDDGNGLKLPEGNMEVAQLGTRRRDGSASEAIDGSALEAIDGAF
jgi:hypothetical protein